MLDAMAKDQGHKCKCFPKKYGLKKFFSVDLQKENGLEKHFSADLKNFNHSKNSAVLEPRTGQFSRTLRLRGQGHGLENVSSRPRMSSRTPPLYCSDRIALNEFVKNLVVDRQINDLNAPLSNFVSLTYCKSLYGYSSSTFKSIKVIKNNRVTSFKKLA